MRKFRKEEQASLMTDGCFWRWRFEKITDVCKILEVDRTLDVDGAEVYWRLQDRRMKPEYEWHPAKSSRASKSKKAAGR